VPCKASSKSTRRARRGSYSNVSTVMYERKKVDLSPKDWRGCLSLNHQSRDNPGLPPKRPVQIIRDRPFQHPQFPDRPESSSSKGLQSIHSLDIHQSRPSKKSDRPHSASRNRQALSFDSNSRWVPLRTPCSLPRSIIAHDRLHVSSAEQWRDSHHHTQS
jgi:hypothetical protein